MSAVDVSVVIPVYNNASTLDELVDRLVTVLEAMPLSFEIVCVDDGSRDASLSILQARAARDPRLRPFALVRNFGSQAAVCAGFDLVRGRRVIAMDADLENCPEDIPALLEPLERGYDLVCGYRENRRAPLLARRLPSLLMNAYVRRQTGTQIRDMACGMRGFQSWVVRDLESEGEGRRLLTPVFLRRARRVAEVPLRSGAKGQSSGHSFLTLLGIAADYYMSTARRPFLVAGMLSAAGVALGIFMLAFGPRLFGLVVTAAGALGGMISLLGEYVQRIYQLEQRIPFYTLRDLDSGPRAAAAEVPSDLASDSARIPHPATPT